jgi:hypothetical protein
MTPSLNEAGKELINHTRANAVKRGAVASECADFGLICLVSLERFNGLRRWKR